MALDEHVIPCNKRRVLLFVGIEMILLLLCDVLLCNYSKQGIWMDEENQGQSFGFFKDKSVDAGRNILLDLLSMSSYE